MVLKEDLMCNPYPTENLILKERRRHHRTCVAPAHWQLRALIGFNSQDESLYYPVGLNSQQIQRYNISNDESSTFRLLTFIPRCLVVKNGWMCAGGENGQYVGLRLDESNSISDTEQPPYELDPHGDYQPGFLAMLNRHRIANKNILAKSKKFGADRINCVTMWFPPPPGRGFAGAYQEPVSILANNDNTVTIVSLRKSDRVDKVITYPGCMNRAVLTPDGRLLIAIGDDPYLYAHKRVEKESDGSAAAGSDASEPVNGKSYEWKECAKIKLKGQRNEDPSEYRGSFAACFNNTGEIVAVGTQYGMICIFNTQALLEGNNRSAMLTCFTSTAPKSGPGAVRDMSFCPGAFDLLAWTEDRATVCVADLRTNFTTRQILKLTDESSYEHVTVQDRTTIDPRFLDTRADRPDTALDLSNYPNLMSDYVRQVAARNRDATRDAAADGNRYEYPISNERERYDYPLTADETQALQALQEHRRRREQREREINSVQDLLNSRMRTNRDRELSGTTSRASGPDLIVSGPSHARPSSVTRNASSSASARERSASVTRAVDNILGNIDAQLDAQRERLRDAQDRARLEDNFPPAGRQARVARLLAMHDRDRQLARRNGTPGTEEATRRDPRPRYFARRVGSSGADPAAEPEARSRWAVGEHESQMRALQEESRTRLLRDPETWRPETVFRPSDETATEDANRESASADAPGDWMPAADTNLPTRVPFVGSGRSGRSSGDAVHANMRPTGSAWDAISNIYNLTPDNEGNITRTRDGGAEGEDAPEGRGDVASLFNLMGQLREQHNRLWGDNSGSARRRMGTGGMRQDPERDETAGLAWSEDGTTLFVGAIDGVYEFHVNTFARKLFPSITMR